MSTLVDTDINIIDLPMKKGSFIRFQIFVFCYLNNLMVKKKPKDLIVSDNDIKCMALIGLAGDPDLTEFCKKVVELKIFKSTQSTRNALDKLEDIGLVIKEGTGRKRLYLSPVLNIQAKEESVLEYRLSII